MLRNKLLRAMQQSEQMQQLHAQLKDVREIHASSHNLAASALAVSAIVKDSGQKVVCVLENEVEAKAFHNDLIEFLNNDVLYYPAFGTDLWRELGPTSAQIGRRISCVSSLLRNDFSCLVLTADALLEKVADPNDVELYKLELKVGDSTPFDQFVRQLVEMGYVREDRVDAPGEVCVRGGIVDLFMFEEQSPFRVEFFGDEVESIRRFDVETQRSIEQCNYLQILPLGSAGPYAPIDE